MRVFIATPFLNAPVQERVDVIAKVYNAIIAKNLPLIITHGTTANIPRSSKEQILKHDLDSLKMSDIVFLYVPQNKADKVSIGAVIEVAHAYLCNIPVVAVVEASNSVYSTHPLLAQQYYTAVPDLKAGLAILSNIAESFNIHRIDHSRLVGTLNENGVLKFGVVLSYNERTVVIAFNDVDIQTIERHKILTPYECFTYAKRSLTINDVYTVLNTFTTPTVNHIRNDILSKLQDRIHRLQTRRQ